MTDKGFSDGSEYEFAVGSLHGLRSWNADDAGRLTASSLGTIWKPGENVSECLAVPLCPRWAVDWVGAFSDSGYGTPCGKEGCNGKYHITRHHNFDPNCDCGFWAYGVEDFQRHSEVTGVIEAYGKTAIGTKGFRAEKAKVVAIYTGKRFGARMKGSLAERLAELYPDAMQFESWKTMLAAYPSVGTKQWCPVDENFWTVDERLDQRRKEIRRVIEAEPPPRPTRFAPPPDPQPGWRRMWGMTP